ncbi:MAG: hypothetical protein SFY92_12365 [Verrucomicrobiae bacterium]|nr:hypothetical protein [Verrucomicrobiae bacterium]
MARPQVEVKRRKGTLFTVSLVIIGFVMIFIVLAFLSIPILRAIFVQKSGKKGTVVASAPVAPGPTTSLIPEKPAEEYLIKNLTAMPTLREGVRTAAANPNDPAKSNQQNIRLPKLINLLDIEPRRENAPTLFDEKWNFLVKLGTKPEFTNVDPAQIKFQVYFYDILGNNKIVATNAKIDVKFLEPPVDWKESSYETMTITYQVPKGTWEQEFRRTNVTRNYYGYIIRVYYKNELQDSKSFPAQLAELFPAPMSIAR